MLSFVHCLKRYEDVLCVDCADIPLSQLENPKTAESALEVVGCGAEQLVLEHSLQGLLTQISCKQF